MLLLIGDIHGRSFWKSEEEWGTWKDEMEYQGHEFVRGDANPKGD